MTETDPAAVVRRFFEALDDGDAFELMHEDIVYAEDPKWPGSDIYHGREAVEACWGNYDEILGSEVHVSIIEVTGVGDQVVAVVEVAGRSRETGIRFDHTWAYLCRTDGERLSYFRAFLDPAEAAAEAG